MVAAGSNRRRRTSLWALAALVALVAAIAGGALLYLHRDDNPGCASGAPCTRVLFLGNSYTSVNDLPTMFGDLAWSGGHRVETGVQAPGAWTFADHAGSPDTRTILNSKAWDVVVLQEQSQIPSVASARQAEMYPAARKLVSLVREVGAEPLFYLTWAHRDGWPVNGMPDYASMQKAIDDGYLGIAVEQHVAVAPVGVAWMSLVGQLPDSSLWQDDGSHPTTMGTYLAACVFYATVFSKSPVGLSYHAGLSDTDAAVVQAAAADTVLQNASRWGLL